MYFAVQGLFGGVATGLATGAVLVALKQNDGAMIYLTAISGVACLIACAFTFILPKAINALGKHTGKVEVTAEDLGGGQEMTEQPQDDEGMQAHPTTADEATVIADTATENMQD